jgi:L-ascorbate metabolism protein UlaG (beta-lactamase superfamily)
MENHTVSITLVGGPTALIEMDGLRVLTDPTFDPPQAYPGAVTLTKLTAPALSPEALGRIDVALVSHDQHFDNLDHAGRALLPRIPRVLTTKVGAARLGGHAEGIDPWQSVDVARAAGRSVKITATPARHGPVGFEPISGDVIGFVLTAPDMRSVYVSGDTVWYKGVADVAERFDIGIAVLFTGAARPRGAFHVTMDGNDAIAAAHTFSNATIIAIHNEGWAHFSESQEDLAQTFFTLGIGDRIRKLQRGVPTVVEI